MAFYLVIFNNLKPKYNINTEKVMRFITTTFITFVGQI